MADSRVLATARRIHIRLRVAVLRDSPHFRGFRPAGGGEASRAWHPREFGAVLGGSASLPLPAPPLPSSSRRYAPQCFVGEYASSPCDVSHRASDEPRRCMSLSSALAPSSLASPSIRRVFLRSFCARRRSVAELICRDNCTATLSDSNSTPTDINYFANDFVRAIISFGDTSAASGFLQISPGELQVK